MAVSYISKKVQSKENVNISEFLQYVAPSLSVYDFLIFDGGSGWSNLDRIWLTYSSSEKVDTQTLYDTQSLSFIKPNTEIILPKKDLNIEESPLLNANQILKQKDFIGYFPDFLELLEDSGYVRAKSIATDANSFSIKEISENILVYVYVRALDAILDLTSFVRSLNTSVVSDAGSFSFSLDPITDIKDLIYLGSNVLNLSSIYDSRGLILDQMEINLQQNDLVLIRFERLEMEEQDRPNSTLEIPNSSLNDPKKVWDMIGLIDSCTTTYNSFTSDKELSVSGRDLNKLLVEDGAYFLPYQYIQGKDSDQKFVWGGDENSSWFKRNVVSGAYDYFFANDLKGIKDSLGFIINHLSNIGICPNSLFDSYEDRSTISAVTGADKDYLKTKSVNGVWQIIKLQIDEVLDNRIFSGTGLMNPDGTLSEFFNQVCQKPFVEFWGDTYGGHFNLIVRQPPFSASAIRDVWNNRNFITIEEGDVLYYNLSFDQRSYASYDIEPQNGFFGHEEGVFKASVPTLVLPEYAEVFGNKRYVVKDSYLHRNSLIGDKSNLDDSKFIEGILNDYKYIIETTAYLPFTRMGSITVNGDRRIKKGCFVFNKSTNELFHVTGVTNAASFSSSSIDRTTTIQVERGMVSLYINEMPEYVFEEVNMGNVINYGNISYFNIVNTDLFIKNVRLNIQSKDEEIKKSIKTDFSTNKKVFEFFTKRNQLKWKGSLESINQIQLIQ